MVKFYYIFIMFCIMITANPAFADDPAVLFDQYRVDHVYHSKKHPVVLKTKQDHMFRTLLRDAVHTLRIDFAGHYLVTYFGCGTQCIQGAVIDAITGNVVWFPFQNLDVTDYFEPVSYCRNSRLIRFVGGMNEVPNSNSESYYELKGNQFVLVKRISLPEPKEGLIGDGPEWQDKYGSNPAYCHPVSETPRIYNP